MLVHAVIVGGDGAAADVGVLAQVGVADIAQVRHLRAVADVRLLYFHERAGLASLAELVARTQIRPRADVGRAADVRLLHAGAFHMRFGVDGGADQRGVRADFGGFADHRMALEEAAGQDHRVACDLHVVLDPRGVRVEDGDAFAHPMLAHALVVRLGERGELHAVVDAFHA